MPVIALLVVLALAPWSVQQYAAKRAKAIVYMVTIAGIFIMSLKLLIYWLIVILKMPAIATVSALTLVPWSVLQEMVSIL